MTDERFEGGTLQETKKYLRRNFDKGCRCPSCGQMVKSYKRGITSAMAYSMILIHRFTARGHYIHVEDLLKEIDCPASTRGDFPKLRFWGLIEPKPERREDDSPRNGYYMVTEKGRDFVRGKVTVPSHVVLYNNKVLGFSEGHVTIQESLKEKFNYSELMNQ